MSLGLTYNEACQLRQIPPFTREEILYFYETGHMPERYGRTEEEEKEEIINYFTNKPVGGKFL